MSTSNAESIYTPQLLHVSQVGAPTTAPSGSVKPSAVLALEKTSGGVGLFNVFHS